MHLERDSSDRIFAALECPATDYGRVVSAIVDRFQLEPAGARIEGLDHVFQDFVVGNSRISLEWDNWMGFQVVAKSRDSESLVEKIAAFLESDMPSA